MLTVVKDAEYWARWRANRILIEYAFGHEFNREDLDDAVLVASKPHRLEDIPELAKRRAYLIETWGTEPAVSSPSYDGLLLDKTPA